MDNLLLEKTIKEIEQLTTTQLNERDGVYDKIFRKLPIIACEPIKESLHFFRVRIADRSVNEQIPSSFSYKPQSLNPKINRLNMQGESMFYGALFPYTAIKECGIGHNQEFYLSRWFIPKEAQLTMYRIFFRTRILYKQKSCRSNSASQKQRIQ